MATNGSATCRTNSMAPNSRANECPCSHALSENSEKSTGQRILSIFNMADLARLQATIFGSASSARADWRLASASGVKELCTMVPPYCEMWRRTFSQVTFRNRTNSIDGTHIQCWVDAAAKLGALFN